MVIGGGGASAAEVVEKTAGVSDERHLARAAASGQQKQAINGRKVGGL